VAHKTFAAIRTSSLPRHVAEKENQGDLAKPGLPGKWSLVWR